MDFNSFLCSTQIDTSLHLNRFQLHTPSAIFVADRRKHLLFLCLTPFFVIPDPICLGDTPSLSHLFLGLICQFKPSRKFATSAPTHQRHQRCADALPCPCLVPGTHPVKLTTRLGPPTGCSPGNTPPLQRSLRVQGPIDQVAGTCDSRTSSRTSDPTRP